MFKNGLKSQWKANVSIVQAHKQFKSYSLAKLIGILRSHKEEVTKEESLVSSFGSFALSAKGKKSAEDDFESKFLDNELSKEDNDLMVSNLKKFFNKNLT